MKGLYSLILIAEIFGAAIDCTNPVSAQLVGNWRLNSIVIKDTVLDSNSTIEVIEESKLCYSCPIIFFDENMSGSINFPDGHATHFNWSCNERYFSLDLTEPILFEGSHVLLVCEIFDNNERMKLVEQPRGNKAYYFTRVGR